MTHIFLSIADVARLTKIKVHQIQYAITNGLIPEASIKVAGKRVFTPDEAKEIAKHFEVEISVSENNKKGDK